jgi:gliding motility-associated-like protein
LNRKPLLQMRFSLFLFLAISFLFSNYGNTQTTVTYNFTGGTQNFVVPPCVTSISVTAAGADGGGTAGGNGAVVTGVLTVTPGQTLQITVGGSGNCPGGGYGGGGNGQNANTGANGACGGGGATTISVSPYNMGARVLVAGGGGGMGGGTQDAIGGAGGCGTGVAGTSPFGQGGGGATQTAGGTAGPPWITSGNPGTAGSIGQGGNGGSDPCYNNSPGGGGGGGYYGGGGGGSDCFDLAPYGGGSGGGGSSLVPAGGGCTQGSNNGPGYVTITYTATGSTVPTFNALGPYCQCSTPGTLPTTSLNGITGSWSPSTISTASAGTTTYTFTPNAGQCAVPTTMNVTITAVSVTMPANGGTTVACPSNTNTAPTPPTVLDNCGRTLTVSGPVVSVNPSCSGTRTYTYNYTNACGTSYPWVYTYTVSPPIVVMPANGSSTVACPSNTNTAPTTPVVTDNCGRTLTVSAPVISAIPTCAGTRTYTYTYTSCNGTPYSWVYTYTVSPPIVVMPANGSSTVACPSNTNTAPTTPVVTDNCGRTLTVSAPVISAIPTCAGTRTYTYTYTSCDGTPYSWVYTYTVSPPIVVMPANGSSTVACPSNTNTAPTTPVVTDNCGRVLTVSAPVISAIPTCAGTRTYTYTYTSCDGTPYSWVYTYTVSPPMVVMPANGSSTVACPAAAVLPSAPTVMDNCGRTLTVSAPVVSPAQACSGTQTYTYTYTDCSGITHPWVYTYMISAPVVVMPANDASSVICLTDIVTPIPPTVIDNCGRTLSIGAPVISASPTCAGPQTYTFTYTDCSGNTYPWIYTYTINDNIPPTASNPATTTIPGGPAPAANPNVVIDEADNCSVPVVAFVSESNDGAACPLTITRIYSVTDACGNSINVTHTLLITDPFPPTASNPAPINVECIADVPAQNSAVVIDEADNQGTPTVAWVSDVSDNGTCPEIITRTYSVTDVCGGQIFVTQTITVLDITAPVFAAAPVNVTVACVADIPAMTNLAYTDNCDPAGSVTGIDVSDGNSCPETITRTWTFSDACGNPATASQTIIVHDLVAPVFAAAPVAVTVACAGDVPAMTDLGYTDNCDPAGTVTGTDASDGNTCPETITRTWTFTDACGNPATTSQTITVHDLVAPVFAAAPADVTVECLADVPAMTSLGYTDNCDPAGTVTGTDGALVGGACGGTITRTWTFTDLCGNTSSTTQTITIDDNTPPTASNPATTTIPGGPAPAADPNVVIDEADNCSVPVVAFVSESNDGAACPLTITRIYSVTDACGNSINVTHTLLITDPFPPTASNPAPINVECIADVPAQNSAVVIDEADNQGTPTVAWVSDVSDNGTCPEIITRTYSVTDVCNNQILVTQTITVNDITAPTASNPVTVNVECIGDVPAFDITVVTDEADNCTAAPIVAFVSDVSDGNTCPETITRTYSVTDDCNNQTLVTQTIIVNDITNPTASNPVAVNVECIFDVPATDIAVVTDEADNCTAAPVVAWVSDVSDGNTCPETITRTYSVTDDCNNQILVTQTIIVNDITNPTASNPADITVPGGPAPAPNISVVTDEADNCTVAPLVTWVSDVSDNQPCPETITRTYSIADDCGNAITVTQLIFITDPIMPTASNPLPVTVECIADVPLQDITVVTDEADNQGVPTVAWVSDVSDNGSCPETITRTYSVTDVCNNQILVTQTITVNDITAPTASNPVTVNVECIGDVPAFDISVVTDEADNCTAVPVVAFVSDISDGNACPETITRTYSVTDNCNNQSLVTQTIIVNDVTAPTASNPVTVNVECIFDVPATDITVVTDEADNCTASPIVAWVSDISDNGSCPETITRTYSVTDDCNNQIVVTQTIIVNDVTNPTASNPNPVAVELATDVPTPDPDVVTDETDNCTAAPVVTWVSDVSDNGTCPEIITRTYNVADDCGNSINVVQTITINDMTLPTASNPATVNVECITDVPAQDITVVTDEADNSGIAPTVTYLSDVSDNGSCPETITRTYEVTDNCGNSITVQQTIIVNDVTPPTATAPLSVTVECIDDVPPVPLTANLVITDASDNCTAVPSVDWISDISDNGTCPETITRTYSITDDCGNQTLVTQSIIVNDVTNPTASNPAGITVECILDVPAPNIIAVTDEADNCTAYPVVAHVSDVSDGNTCPETITRTYSVTDDCGNQIVVTQTIIVNDVTNPTASNPAPISVVSAATVPAPDPSVVINEADNCTTNPLVTWVSDVSDGNICNNEQITRTYSITDDCGNSITVNQIITITAIYPTINAGIDQTVCEGESVILNATYSPATTVISWPNPTQNGIAFVPAVGSSSYVVTANNYDCITTDQVNITVHPLPQPSFIPDENMGCMPFMVQFTNTSSSTSPIVSCTWNMGDGTTLNGCGDQNYLYEDAGFFTVSLTTTDANGCTNSVSYTNLIYVEPYPVADFSASEYELNNLMITSEVEFYNESVGAISYVWDFGDGSASAIENPTYIFETEDAGSYQVMLIATSPLGCADTAYHTFSITEELIYYIPNTFTPDGDQYNNTFQPVFTLGFDPYDFTLLIYNRWGELIFESHDASIGWDGTYGGKLMQDGSYTWKINFKSRINDKKYTAVGHVNLIR